MSISGFCAVRCENAEQRQTRGKETAVGFAIVAVGSLAFAAAAAANSVIRTFFALFWSVYAIFYEIKSGLAVRHFGKVGSRNVSEQPFVEAIKITRIDISVGFRDKLPTASAQKSALFGHFSEIHSDPVIEKPYRNVIPVRIIFDVFIENSYEKRRIIVDGHIGFALFRTSERS